MTELEPGFSAPTRNIGPITQTDIVRFAGAGGDFNPLHHDPEFVRASGFPGVIAMGQLHAGILGSYLTDWVGVERVREFGVRFVAPVFVGDNLAFDGTVSSSESGIAEISLKVTRGSDTIVTGRAAVSTSSP
ncbi:MaoC/PaaZ C-terminal domain-containing protein [Rhodococcoides kyotonense]|uniref:MaoC like domain-containing protein n=1 Tax=Rhodococcoides kyotonense TaxID=398843 RepID=A0A239K4X8_9NOCA|nr:MaoC/PaaZ C-terminal domain-containing protein [Rhodococcus kyotonensis]SNT12174.1 MaoC like domain-containing protein [Rhodococcus kyotonensis]